MADFLVDHPSIEINLIEIAQHGIVLARPWVLQFDGSVMYKRNGVGLTIRSPIGREFHFMICLAFQFTNRQAEYEALIQGLLLLKERNIDNISVQGDLMIIIQQAKGENHCRDPILEQYCTLVQGLACRFKKLGFHHIYRAENQQANDLA